MSSSSLAITRPDPTPRRWKHGAIPVIGLIGGIGAGKSRVAELLKGRGACVIDADAVGHEVLEVPRCATWSSRGSAPGSSVPRRDPARREAGSIAASWARSSSPIRRHCATSSGLSIPGCAGNSSSGSPANPRGAVPLIVLDAAILMETGWDRVCDLVAFVDAPFPVRLDRVSRARGWTGEDLRSREAAQWPVDRKRDGADVVLHNESGLEALELEVDAFFRSLAGRDPVAPFPRAESARPAGTIRCRVQGNPLVQAQSRAGPSDLGPPRCLDRCPPSTLHHPL